MTAADQPPLILVIMPSSGTATIRKPKRSIDEDVLDIAFTDDKSITESSEILTAPSGGNSSAPADANPMCYPSNRTCDYASSSCSGHGSCVLVSNSTKESRTGECWACKCASGYVGAQCQKGDYVL